MGGLKGGTHEPSLDCRVLVIGRGRGMGKRLDEEILGVVLGAADRILFSCRRLDHELAVEGQIGRAHV